MLGNQSDAVSFLQQRYKLNLSENELKKLLGTNDLESFQSPEFDYNQITVTKEQEPIVYQPPVNTPIPLVKQEGDLSEYYYTFIDKSKQFEFTEIKPKIIRNDYKLYNEINSRLEFNEIIEFKGPFDLNK